MKKETRDTVLMILKADPTVTQQLLDAIALAMEGGELSPLVHVKEAVDLIRVSERQVYYLAKVGKLKRVPGTGSRALGFTRASVANYLLARSLENANRQ